MTPIQVSPGEDLAAVIAAAPPGAVVVLAAGNHPLSATLVVTSSLTLRGAGRDRCRVVSRALGLGIHVAGAHFFMAEDLAFEHDGPGWGHVMQIEDAEITLRGCRFRDHLRREPPPDVGDGLRVGGAARGLISRCEFVDNGHHGLVLLGKSDVRVADCELRDNRDAGLALRDRARGTIERCRVDRNGVGVLVAQDAAPRMFDVAARANARDGFVWSDHASGRAAGCVAEDNRDGFMLGDQARPTLTAAIATRNRECGLRLTDRAAPIILGARVRDNAGPGVLVTGRAAPALRAAMVARNGRAGLAYLDDAAGEATRCEITEHAQHGIAVHQRARPALRHNVSRANGWAGLAYLDESTGEAEGNLLERNHADGVAVQDQASPRLRGNLARCNGGHGFTFAAGSGAHAEGNGAEENGAGAFVVAPPPRFRKTAVVLMGNVEGPIDLAAGTAKDEPSRHLITPDRDLRELIQGAEPGALLELAPGEFELSLGAIRRSDLVIRGAGRDRTTIQTGSGDHLLRFEGPGQLLIDGVTLERRGYWGPILVVAGGEVEVVDCDIRGGKRQHQVDEGGDGVRVEGPRRLVLRGTRVTANGGWGVLAADAGARVTLDGSDLAGNGAGACWLPASPPG